MKIYSELEIETLYLESLADAVGRLSGLVVAEGRPSSANLAGWVFEQTIRYCLTRELARAGLNPPMQEQVPLRGRARVDLLIGNVAIEIKSAGSFGGDDSKYERYRNWAEERNWVYCYLTLEETHPPFRRSTESMFGPGNSFFLDSTGDWSRFVDAVIACLNDSPKKSS